VKKTTRIGVGGPVGSGKTALIEVMTPRLLAMGLNVLIITNGLARVQPQPFAALDEEKLRAVRACGEQDQHG
jgi:Ni2+-binding GTPase involved in maturation of urease and hydrogenase